MRFSSSLQELPTFSVEPLERSSSDLESNRNSAKASVHFPKEGTPGSFSKERLPSTPTKKRKWAKVIIFCFVLLFLLILSYACLRYFADSQSHGGPQYYVILDCGSTGTRVNVYEWSIDQTKSHMNFPIILRSSIDGKKKKWSSFSGRAYQRMETEPGFDKLVYNESGLRAAIEPLLQMAEKHVPKRYRKNTQLFLYATAGVRKLPSSESSWVLDTAWNILQNSSFMCSRERVKIISGMEEAYYGWVALNHHMGRLGSLSSKMTFGSLDLGGSSLQVTFETEKAMQDDTSVSLRVGSISHQLSAYSLTGYGLNDAFSKSVAHLLKRIGDTPALTNGRIEAKHPCLQDGYREEYFCSYCPAVKPDGTLDRERKGSTVVLLGAPKWDECSELAKTTVNLSEWSNTSSGIDCKFKPCALADHLPQPRGRFFAMSGFFVVFKFFNLSTDANLIDVLAKGREFCAKPWDIARSSVQPQPFIEQYCFRAPYIASLLRDGLHIKDSQVVIGSGSITWTLGVALLEAGQELSKRIDLPSYVLLHKEINSYSFTIFFLVSVILLLFALVWANNCIPGIFRKPYLPLFRSSNGPSGSMLKMPPPFRFPFWSSLNAGEGKTKTPLSPTVTSTEQHAFALTHGLGGSSLHLAEAPAHGLVYHSLSTSSLGQMQYSSVPWKTHRGQQMLQSRRSQSREDLMSSLAEAHVPKA